MNYHVIHYPNEQRIQNVEVLQTQIPQLVVVRDNTHNALDTFLQTLEKVDNEASVILEDDVILCTDFIQKIEKVISLNEERFINFFSRRQSDLTIGTRDIPGASWSSNCCFYIPKGHSKQILKFYNEAWSKVDKQLEVNPTGTDTLLADYLKFNKIKYLNYVPSLVQHLNFVSAINSRRSKNRQSKTFEL